MSGIDEAFETWKKGVFRGAQPGEQQQLQADMAFYAGVVACLAEIRAGIVAGDQGATLLNNLVNSIGPSIDAHEARVAKARAAASPDAAAAFHEQHETGGVLKVHAVGPEAGKETLYDLVGLALHNFVNGGGNALELRGDIKTSIGEFNFHFHLCVHPVGAVEKPHAVH